MQGCPAGRGEYSRWIVRTPFTVRAVRTILAWVFRIVLAKDCLIHTDKQIAQIAQEAGYANLSNFTRRFKSSEEYDAGAV